MGIAKLLSPNILRMIFFLSVIVTSLIVVTSIPRVTVPLGLSYILYLVFSPVYEKLIALRVPPIIANLTIVFVLIFIMFSPLSKILPLVKDQSQNFDSYLPRSEYYLKKYYSDIQTFVEKKTAYKVPDNFLNDFISNSKTYLKGLALELPQILGSALEWVFIIPLLLFFMLKDGGVFKKLVLRITPNSIFEKFYAVGHQFNKKLGGYMLAKFFEASLLGLMITISLYIAGVEFSLILGLIAAATNIIPYVGPLLGSVPGIIIVLAKYGPSNLFYIVMFIYIIVNVIDIAIIFPILVSKIVDLHPVVVVMSVILGSQYFGLVGMIISIPIAAAIKLIGVELYEEFYLT